MSSTSRLGSVPNLSENGPSKSWSLDSTRRRPSVECQVADALTWLGQSEDLDRGWYAGPVGFSDLSGNGVYVVAIRSAPLATRPSLGLRRRWDC